MTVNQQLIEQLKFLESELKQYNSEAETNKNVVEKLKAKNNDAYSIIYKYERTYPELVGNNVDKENLHHQRSISNPETEMHTELQKEITNQIEEHSQMKNVQTHALHNRVSTPNMPIRNELLAYLEAPVYKRGISAVPIRRQPNVSNTGIPKPMLEKKSKENSFTRIPSNRLSQKKIINRPQSVRQSTPIPPQSSQIENKIHRSLEPFRPVIKNSRSDKSNRSREVYSTGLTASYLQNTIPRSQKQEIVPPSNPQIIHGNCNHRSNSCNNFLDTETHAEKGSENVNEAKSIPIATNEIRKITPPSSIPMRPIRMRANSCESLLTPESPKEANTKIPSVGSKLMGKIVNSQIIINLNQSNSNRSEGTNQREIKKISAPSQQTERNVLQPKKSDFVPTIVVSTEKSNCRNKLRSQSEENILKIPVSKTNSVILKGSEFDIISIESRTRAQQMTLKELENKYFNSEKKLTKDKWQIFLQEYTANQNTIKAIDDEWLSVFTEVLTSNSEYIQDMTEIRKLINSIQVQSKNLFALVADMTE